MVQVAAYAMWRKDCSWAENVLSSWACLLLALLAITSLLLRYATDPIHCITGPPSAYYLGYAKEKCFQEREILVLSDEVGTDLFVCLFHCLTSS